MRIVFFFSAFFVCNFPCLLSAQQSESKINFDRDIRPILSDRCYRCHGPDGGTRKADLRLDMHDAALEVIVPGNPEESELLRRITSEDSDELMPPAESNLAVTAKEKQLIADWIKQGAAWKKHWAFEQRSRPGFPTVKAADRVSSPIDRFLLSKLESNGLSYSESAPKEKLIRRVTFDLTGLPPTLDEIDAFLGDDSADAFGKVVDRLLRSEHYGQRIASDWLDVARYSDTYGYQVDRDRYVWPWRDWVIRAFNANMSYDQFITEQLAGDLLSDPTDDQILATTFNRLHPQKVEGGSVEEEFRVEYVVDRVQTFATAFLGLTLECARCHDHKYDPLSQAEYYQLFSYFNNIDESGLYSYFTNSVPTPTLAILSDEQKKKIAVLRADVESHTPPGVDKYSELSDVDLLQAALKIQGRDPIESVDFSAVDGRNAKTTDLRGRPASKLTGDDAISLKTGNFRRYAPFSVSLSVNTPDTKQRAVVFHRSRAWTDAGSRGYQLLIEEGKLSASLIHFWPGNAIGVKTLEEIPVNRWLDVAVVYDGSITAEGISIFVDGKRVGVEITKNNLTKNITGGGGDNIAIGARFRDRGFTNGQVSSFNVYDRQISDLEVALAHDEKQFASPLQLLDKDAELSESMRFALVQHLELNQSKDHVAYRQQLASARELLCNALDPATEIMVMRELPHPKPSFVLQRGHYGRRLEQVTAATPAVFPAMKESLPSNRLGLARWLTDPDHPLTARVAVNHYWQLIFGDGIVRTPEDFGRQGALPTHPELLDWMANDFVSHGWDVKRLLKQMVMSTAYRQTSVASKDLLKIDPENELLARAPSYRLSAEMLRDNVLVSSGLLVDKIGGPPAKPYELAASFKPSTPDKGDGLYRRSLYTYWKRTGPAPVMMALDAAKRDVCRVKRERTSSPLQALAMLNGPQFVEAGRALSQQLLTRHGNDAVDAITQDMFRMLTSRRPSEQEATVIRTLYRTQREHFLANPDAVLEYLSNGQFGDYAKTVSGLQLPPNKHEFHLGTTPNGQEKFLGEFGRASVFAMPLNESSVKSLAALPRDQSVTSDPKPVVSSRIALTGESPTGAEDPASPGGHAVFNKTAGLTFADGLTLEAWIKPTVAGRGRIWDKITPGQADGLLLDLNGGLRFICGGTVCMADRAPAVGEWSHVACTANFKSRQIRFYLNGEPAGGVNQNPDSMSNESLASLAAWSSVANMLINHDECVTKR
ncbi:MAG: DUF1553 domain-containing protein [Rubripirellula sp.]|nr:DUF1553 domain-containing protein [Rubripirellula sp.]